MARAFFAPIPTCFREPLSSPPTDGELRAAWADVSTSVLRAIQRIRLERGKPLEGRIVEARERILALRTGGG